ncbi:MAG: NMD3-related protein [Promethearchaeota archaeon]
MPRRFCARCGSPITEDNPYSEGFFCKKCSEEASSTGSTRNVKFSYFICPVCFRVSKRGTKQGAWLEPDSINFEDLSVEVVEKFFLKKEKLHGVVDIKPTGGTPNPSFDIIVRGEGSTEKFSVEVVQKTTACPICSKKAGGSFSSTLQVRIPDGRFKGLLRDLSTSVRDIIRLISERNPGEYLVKETKRKTGVDFDFSTKGLAYRIGAELKKRAPGLLKMSKKLMGIDREQGGEIYRYTVSFRVVPVKRGDVLDIGGVPYLVNSLDPYKVELIGLATGETLYKDLEWFSKSRPRYYHKVGEGVGKFIVVSIGGTGAQLMAGENYITYEVDSRELPPEVREGQEVEGVVIDGKLFLLGQIDELGGGDVG